MAAFARKHCYSIMLLVVVLLVEAPLLHAKGLFKMGDPAPDIVMYLGCNVLKTPHIALLCLEVLDRLGARYKVFAGPAYCCGVIQYRAGDAKTSGRSC